jgi:hypothetical protein
VKEKIRVEPRLREVEKKRAAKITKHMKLAPSASSGTRFNNDEGWPFGKSGVGFSYPVSELIEMAVISCSGIGLIPPISRSPFRGITIFIILCEITDYRNKTSKEKADPSRALLSLLTHISVRAGGESDGCTHSFI